MKSDATNSTRRQVITDPTVQGELLFRALIYWFLCLTTVLMLAAGWTMWTQPPAELTVVALRSLDRAAPVIAGAVLLLPLLLFDVLRISNKFVTPVHKARFVLEQLANGSSQQRVLLRKEDFWQDLAHSTNVLAEELEQLREPPADAETTQNLAESDSVSERHEEFDQLGDLETAVPVETA